jgi:small GTP-binding protein
MSISSNIITTNEHEVLPDGFNKYDLSFKIIVLGNSGVGKSCLTLKGTKNIFPMQTNTTVGFEYFTFTVKIENSIVKLQIWDTCGQETYKSLVMNFYRNSSLAIVVYAVNDRVSFDDLEIWLKELKMNSNPNTKIILVGNKNDVEKREVTYEEGLRYKQENNFDLFLETSAKLDENAKDLFAEAAKMLYKDYQNYIAKTLSEEGENSKFGIKGKRLGVGKASGNANDKNERLPSKASFILKQQQMSERDRSQSSSCGC